LPCPAKAGHDTAMVDRLVISDIGHRGDGVASSPDGPLFVPYTLPGETVDADAVQGHPDRRHLLRVVVPSPDRVDPFCEHFGVCGGCAIQHWAEPHYRAWKRNLVVEALRQAGIDAPVDELIDAHGEGRRRAVLHARQGTKEIVEVGFSALRAHTLVPIEVLGPLKKPLDVHATATLNGLDIDVRGSGPLDQAHALALTRIAASGRIARITRHGEMVALIAPPVVQMGKAQVTLPPGPFLQATAQGEQTLADLVLQSTGKAKTALDLFCGIGPFTLRLAETMRVTAIDSDQPAIDALSRAAQATSGLKQVTAMKRDLFRLPMQAMDLAPFDVVVFDPPRQGAEAQAREIAKSKVKTVVAVSCNAATFARDAAIRLSGGYRLMRVTPVDQFKHTAHVEIVARFVR
jgi:23S rRNA (uracil1939-C5)-methyltransferase